MTRPDPEELRRLGHEVVDLLAEYLAGVEDRALFPDIEPARLDELFDEPVPEEPMPAEDVLREVCEKLLPHSTAVNHPGYLGLITSTPTPIGILGDFIASALNQNIGAYSIGPAGVAMELRTVRWLADLAGYDERAGGNLTSGGMMANFIGLKLARDWASGEPRPARRRARSLYRLHLGEASCLGRQGCRCNRLWPETTPGAADG